VIDPAGFIAAIEPRGGIANADGSPPPITHACWIEAMETVP
jgi:hypothetical protein